MCRSVSVYILPLLWVVFTTTIFLGQFITVDIFEDFGSLITKWDQEM